MTKILLFIIFIKVVIIVDLLKSIKKKNKKIKRLEYYEDLFINKYTDKDNTPLIAGGKL